MAGHSKWANIKHRKGRADAIKGKIFSRITKEIITAVRQGGPDPKSNSKLRLILSKARDANMPNENIDRNIKKASSVDQSDYFEMTYELYGHGGVGLIVEIISDNKNRVSSDIHIATMKRGGKIATSGAVSFNFDRKGVLQILKASGAQEADLFSCALEAGADDFEAGEDSFIVMTAPDLLYQVKEEIEKGGFKVSSTELEWIPKVSVDVQEEVFQSNLQLIEWLEDLDDVDGVYHNMQLIEP